MRILVIAAVLMALAIPGWSTAHPFPHAGKYANGIRPTAAPDSMNQAALYAYYLWSDNYITNEGCPQGAYRVQRAEAYNYDTVSEGIGWGMLITVLMDNQQTDTRRYFDGFWQYYQSHLNKHGLMAWKIARSGKAEFSEAATEADQNVALALLFASKQWGNGGRFNYLSEAGQLISKIFSSEVEAKSFVLKPGADWGGFNATNPGYFAPAYYRIFAQFDDNWLKVADRCYKIYDIFYDRYATGLFPDWTVADGSISYRSNNFTYDACQAPLKISLDYLWNGQGEKYLQKINYWLVQETRSDPAAIVDGYTLDGAPIGKYHNAAFVGPLTVSAMVADKYQTWLDMLYDHLVRMDSGGKWGYYQDTLRLVSLLILSGNFPNLWEAAPEPQEWLKS